MANSIGLVGLLEQHAKFEDISFSVLADGGYRAEDQVIIPYAGPNLTQAQEAYNKLHASHRVSIEIAIGMITNTWQRLK